ncbi:OmpA family protein [Oxalobacteraceae bacterium R-40]|uniref:OmpA family protein n=1 Tax=Keguizhuia sedimenti TaxID=3064264 RepID=A0ABU1BKA0_9BURK|nr:OmpA family protein [Oxalobacteraceae bacterium R-40]
MKKITYTPIILAIAVLMGACSSIPTTTSLLDQTRSDYIAAQTNPNIAAYAPVEMKQATQAMEQADAASEDRDNVEKIDKLAYLAKQKIALAQEVAKQKSAEAAVTAAGKERDQMRLEQRDNDVNRANANAAQSKLASEIARVETAQAQSNLGHALARTEQLESQLADMAAKKTERGLVITLGDVLFGSDMSRLNADGVRTVQKLAAVLQQHPQRTVLIEGFTDDTGTASHNQRLSERRAGVVLTALQEAGISSERIALRGYGESHPVAGNTTAAERQLNRRVEIILSDADGKVMQRQSID